jgi:hypothetical protein
VGIHVSRRLAAAAVLALAVLAGCTNAPEADQDGSAPVDTVLPYSSPAGGSDNDYDVDAMDPCAPFASPLWRDAAAIDPQLAPQATPEPPGGCRWRGPGMTATLAVESGRSLRDYSIDPAFRPGERGWQGNSYWMTEASDEKRECQVFLAVGPAQPDRVVHLTVQTEEIEAPLQGGGDAHACVFVRSLLIATSSVLRRQAEATR